MEEEADWERMKARMRCSVARAERTNAVWVGETRDEGGRPKRRGPKKPEMTEGVCED